MKSTKLFSFVVAAAVMSAMVFTSSTAKAQEGQTNKNKVSKVYMIKDITPENLIKIYKALGVPAKGRVAVKISTGEAGGHYYLSPDLIGPLVKSVKGTIVECNTAYPGSRNTTERHEKVVEDHGFNKIAKVDIMDKDGSMSIPVKNGKHLKEDLVGKDLANYDFIINLAHFKGHQMAGFGGVLKNMSIGIASSKGKSIIHSAGTATSGFGMGTPVDDFQESMAEAAKAVSDYKKGNIIYIDVMNNISIDCDCDSHPAKPEIQDIGILASTDPIAVDRACLDLIYKAPEKDRASLVRRIESRHGQRILQYGEEIGLGSQKYEIVNLK